MKKKLSTRVRLNSLSDVVNVDVGTLARVLDEEYQYQPAPLDEQSARTVPTDMLSRAITTQLSILNRQTVQQQIDEAEGSQDLWNILQRLSVTDAEYPSCYEKLAAELKRELLTANDEETLNELYGVAPHGSPEEKNIYAKMLSAEQKAIEAENDFDDLVQMYQSGDYEDSLQLLENKLIQIASSPSETKELIDNAFIEHSLAYYRAVDKHCVLLRAAIAAMKDPDDADDVYDLILDHGTEEELLLAERIVALAGSDASAIWTKEDVFEDGSEAKEILALGVINATTQYAEDDALADVVEDFDEGTRICRLALKKQDQLFMKYLLSLKDPDDVEAELDSFSERDPGYTAAAEHLVSLTKPDELQELIERRSEPYLKACATDKLNGYLKEKCAKATKLGDIIDLASDMEVETEIGQVFLERIIALANRPGDLEGVYIPPTSYAGYAYAKKFPQAATSYTNTAMTSIGSTVSEERKNDAEKPQSDSDIRSAIRKAADCLEALKIYRSLPSSDPNKKNAYNRAAELLRFEMHTPPDRKRLFLLAHAFPENTAEWGSVLKAFAVWYKKPWYVF